MGSWELGGSGTRAQELQLLGSRAQAQQLGLRCRGLVALWCVGSSWTSNQTCIRYNGRRILNHWISREVQLIFTVTGWASNSLLYVTIYLENCHFESLTTCKEGIKKLIQRLSTKTKIGNSLAVQWLGLRTFTAVAKFQTLVGELGSHKARPKQ